jgi:CheY-like chemotaxis protein
MSSAAHAPRASLVVEDNEVIRDGLAAILRRQDYAVALAANGQAALDYLKDNASPALIALDTLMPVLDGWAFLQPRQRLPTSASVPVLITTATILTREWASDHGYAGLIHKPIDAGELLGELRV